MRSPLRQFICAVLATMLAVAVSTASAGENAVSTNYRVELKRGISFAQFTNGLGAPPTHEFTLRRGSNIVRCVSQCIDKPFQKYYFVFVDGRLTTVCEPPPFDYTTVPYRGARLEVRKPWKPEERVEQVMQSNDLTGTALLQSIDRRKRPSRTGPAQFPPGIASRFSSEAERANKALKVVAQRFDPIKVALGDGLEAVEAQFGSSHHAETLLNRHERRCYGSPRHGVNIEVWVMVGFNDGKVVEIFSDDFFDTEKIVKSSR